jgi:DNA-binding CsgD family transcriptional regulator
VVKTTTEELYMTDVSRASFGDRTGDETSSIAYDSSPSRSQDRDERLDQPRRTEPAQASDYPHGALEADEDELTPRQEQIVLLLSARRTRVEIAEILGTSTKTIQRELGMDHVQAALNHEVRNRVSEIRARLLETAHQAVLTLDEGQQAESPADRIRAAKVSLDLAFKCVSMTWAQTLPTRMDRIEKLLDELTCRDEVGD